MFAVFRGKVSEGLDFSDNKARAVVSIGNFWKIIYELIKKMIKANFLKILKSDKISF
jgi:hypothetical protein